MGNIIRDTVRYNVPGADAQIIYDLEFTEDTGTLVSSTFKGVEFNYGGSTTMLDTEEVEQLVAVAERLSELRSTEEGGEQ